MRASDGLGSVHMKFDLVGGGEKEGFNQKCISRNTHQRRLENGTVKRSKVKEFG